jgi:hypothetical protein
MTRATRPASAGIARANIFLRARELPAQGFILAEIALD